MNIIVKPYDSKLCYCRPDTTWEKESRDLYIPDKVNKVLLSPVVYARVCKAGKCISGKFVSRYYDTVGFGALIYCDEDSLAFSSCLDHTSLLPVPSHSPEIFENESGEFTIKAGSKEFAFKPCKEFQTALEEVICTASERVSLRIGDMVALELGPMAVVAEHCENEAAIKAEFSGDVLFDLKVIL